MGVHLWCRSCQWAYDGQRGTTPTCPVCGSYELEPHRIHDPAELDTVAFLHSRTPITELSSMGVQARAWYIVSRLPDVAPPDGVDTPQALAAIIGFYATVFELDPQAVAEDIQARYEPVAPGS